MTTRTDPIAAAHDADRAPAAWQDGARRHSVQQMLLAWYAANGRSHLPWRHTRDPYAVLVSEVMLQQTQVERVLPKYAEFLACFPTLAALAAAPTADVIRAWASLGYNLRAVRLQAIARQVLAEHDGALPDTLEGLLALKGIGRYTAGAVACFAFGLPVATVDTNIRRVLWRVFRGVEPSAWPTGERATRTFLELAQWALPTDAAYDWQQALMDLGATVCISRRPLCEQCPLTARCAAYAETASATLFPSGEALARLRDERAALHTPERDGAADAAVRRVAEQRGSYRTDGAADSAEGTAAATRPRRTRAPAQPFHHSSRYYRGRTVAALRSLGAGESLTLALLGPRVKDGYGDEDLPWLRTLVVGLARDGLVQLTTTTDGEERIALP